MNHEPHCPEMWPSGWRLRKACVGRLWRERKPNLFEPAKCSQHLTGFRWCSVRSAVWQPAKPLRAFCRCSRASNDTGAPCNPIRGRAAGWCARSEEDTCSMLRAFSRPRGRNVPASASRCLIPRQCPYYDCNRPPWCVWSDEEKRWLRGLAARHGPRGTCLKGSGPMLGLSFDAEQGCW